MQIGQQQNKERKSVESIGKRKGMTDKIKDGRENEQKKGGWINKRKEKKRQRKLTQKNTTCLWHEKSYKKLYIGQTGQIISVELV